jgi:hypothetical protein
VRHLIATALAWALLLPICLLGLGMMSFERLVTALFGEDVYWSERRDSPVR